MLENLLNEKLFIQAYFFSFSSLSFKYKIVVNENVLGARFLKNIFFFSRSLVMVTFKILGHQDQKVRSALQRAMN